MSKRYRKPEEDNIDSYRPQPLSLDRPVVLPAFADRERRNRAGGGAGRRPLGIKYSTHRFGRR
ncbi:MAG: hypothetical protein AAGF95_24970 [Chloroflexota bacterium]